MSNIYDFICKKRDGFSHSPSELKSFVKNIDKWPTEQISAWLMAVLLKGMSPEETLVLTDSMASSGKKFKFPFERIVDKHSTGGVGDKTSLILAPAVAACDIYVPMMSGRGLGHTGGTLDKLESIPGFNTQLTEAQYTKFLKKNHCVMVGQTKRIAPADKRLYSIRDVTGTVESIPLITASILSKKIAEGAKHLVMDVKTGNGAFMKELPRSKLLLQSIIEVGQALGLKVSGVISDMNEPLGRFIGHTLEMKECLEILHGERAEKRLMDLTKTLGAMMLQSVGVNKEKFDQAISSGKALEKFCQITKDQKGNVKFVENPNKLPVAKHVLEVKAIHEGFISEINTRDLGLLLIECGGGRKKISDKVDLQVGFEMTVTRGQRVEKNQTLMKMYLRKKDQTLVKLAQDCFQMAEEAVVPKLIY